LSAAPVVQLWRFSDAAFQAARPDDLVFVITDYKCGTTTANAVWALNGNSGSVAWTSSGFFPMDRGTGLEVDYERNTVYGTADDTLTAGSATVFGLATTNGFPRWALPLGAVLARPLVANGALYVGAKKGTVYKLNPATGAPIWTNGIFSGGFTLTNDLGFDPRHNRVLVTGSDGRVFALDDLGGSAAMSWSNDLNGGLACSKAVVATNFDKIYVGARNGRVYQLNGANGAVESYGTVQTGSPVFDLTLDSDAGGPALYRLVAMAPRTLVRAAIPWGLSPFDKGALTPVQADLHLYASPVEAVTTTAPGQPIAYALEVFHSGTARLNGVTLWDTLPPGMEFQSATASQGSLAISGNSLAVELGYLWNTATVSVVATASGTGTFSHTAAIGGIYRDTGPGESLWDNWVMITHHVVESPILDITRLGEGVRLSWPTNAARFRLTSATNLNTTNWVIVNPAPVVEAGHFVVTNTIGAEALFYRLRSP
jgi:uncharacterized repeat protein (TIGR01451 family)